MWWNKSKDNVEDDDMLEMTLSVSNYPDIIKNEDEEEPSVNEMLLKVLDRLSIIEKKIDNIKRSS